MTSNTSASLHPVPSEQAPKEVKPPQFAAPPSPKQSSALGRAAAKFGACFNGLACPAAGALIIASAFLVLRYKNKMKKTTPKPATRPITRSMSLAMLYGGEKAIQRFKEFHRVPIEEEKLNAALEDMRKLLNEEQINFVDLYAKIGIFEMTEKEEMVIKLLEEALEKAKKVAKAEHTQTTHELQLLLVEMIIYKGNYQKALEYLSRDGVLSTADARVPLYKAVIYSFTNQRNTAKRYFDEYIDTRNNFHGSKFYKDAQMNLPVSDFEDFSLLVKNIQKEIQTAHPGQTTSPQRVQETAKSNQKDSGGKPEPAKSNQKDSGVKPEPVGATPESTSQDKPKEVIRPNEGQQKEK